MTEQRKPPEGIGPASLLRDVLVNTHFEPGRVLPSSVQQISLGVFFEEARILSKTASLNSPNTDYMKFIYVTGSGKVLVPSGASNDLKDYSDAARHISLVPKTVAKNEKLDEKYLGMVMHADSNQDHQFALTGHHVLLFAKDTETLSPSGIFFAGNTHNMLTFRGSNTPTFTSEEVLKRMTFWEWQIENLRSQAVKPGIPPNEAIELLQEGVRALFRQIVTSKDLQYFEGRKDQDVVTRTQP